MKRIIIIFFTIVIITSGSFIIYLTIGDKNKENNNTPEIKKDSPEKEECNSIDGGSYNLIFNTNGGKEISSMNICIVCSPDSYKDIPTPVRDGYNFDGWYYDKELTNKIEFTSTKNFEVIPEYDNNKCIIGYKDIEIFAKWIEKPKETTKKNTTVQKKSSTNTTKKKEEVKKETTPKETNTKEFYYPSKAGVIFDNFGNHSGYFLNYMKIHTNLKELYPINDAEVVAWKYYGSDNSELRYILYKTTLKEKDIYVMYSSYCNFVKVKDYDMNDRNSRIVKYDDTIAMLSGNCRYDIGNYRVVLAYHFSDDYKYVANVMLKNSGNDYNKFININQVFGLNVGDTFQR
ncbi:MAG: InlB B-repeat-containing protein [Bacilli bacterium]|nr:InlB B-repeat-containing protein [Bacilli bacterium]